VNDQPVRQTAAENQIRRLRHATAIACLAAYPLITLAA
jgi:hypothetical protein